MNNFFGKTNGRIHILHLRNGEDVLEEFLKFLQREKIKNGVVISGIGTLCACSFHGVVKGSLPAVDHFYKMENVSAEVSGMSGIIAEGQPHLHMVVTIFDENFKTYAAHIEPGCKVLCLAEIAVLEMEEVEMSRVKDEDGIFQLVGRAMSE